MSKKSKVAGKDSVIAASGIIVRSQINGVGVSFNKEALLKPFLLRGRG
jgi:hypothetical protein